MTPRRPRASHAFTPAPARQGNGVRIPSPRRFANAIGAAIAQVGGEVDRVFSLDAVPREQALAQAKEEASQRVLKEGALPESVEIVEVEEIPLSYLPGNATRIRVKAVGTLALG